MSSKLTSYWLIHLIAAIFCSHVNGAQISPLPSDSIPINNIREIILPQEPSDAERQTAYLLQRQLNKHYKIKANISSSLLTGNTRKGSIFVGRGTACAAGLITEEELEAVKHDGYVIRSRNGKIALAGYGPQGTIYAGYAFLSKLGLKFYPWHTMGGLEVFSRTNTDVIQPFDISDKPFFDHRDVFAQYDGGRFGGTIRKYALGDLRFAQKHPYFKDRGWLGWDHTAAYLVPPALYKSEHPKFYSNKKPLELLKTTPNLRVSLCMCEPDVHRIAAERALEWISKQPDRRYYAITDGDAGSNCPNCTATDPIPDYHTDRLLRWVNSVARVVAKQYPDKRLFTLAYQDTVKPPVSVGLEPNVTVVYAPWYWSSRTTSAVGLNSPLNWTAWKELTAWTVRFPGQIGVYDYPSNWVHGTATRIKEYANLGVRWVYMNKPRGELLHWVSSQLLWDPKRETSKLIDEFLDAFYGPAAIPMRKLLEVQAAAITTAELKASVSFISQPVVNQAIPLLAQASEFASKAEPSTSARIYQGVVETYSWLLREAKKGDLSPSTQRVLFSDYLRAAGSCLDVYATLSDNQAAYKKLTNQVGRQISLVIQRKLAQKELYQLMLSTRESLFRSLYIDFEKILDKARKHQAAFPTNPTRSIDIHFDKPDEAEYWRMDSTTPQLISPPSIHTIAMPDGGTLSGIRIATPFSSLPVVKRGNQMIHAGRFFAERSFKPSINAKGLPFVDLHLFTDTGGLATIYLNKTDQLRSDVRLSPGEQIIRIDLRNYRGTRFDPDKWDGIIDDVAIDFWPQDFIYPYMEASDSMVIIAGLRLSNDTLIVPASNSTAKPIKTRIRTTRKLMAKALDGLLSQCQSARLSCEQVKKLGEQYWSRRINERFRTFSNIAYINPGNDSDY